MRLNAWPPLTVMGKAAQTSTPLHWRTTTTARYLSSLRLLIATLQQVTSDTNH